MKAQSQIIGAVLLILIAISASIFIGAFALKFVNKQLEQSNCFNVKDKLEISDSKYTCYDPSNNMLVQIHLLDAEIEGFKLEIGGDSTFTYTVKQGEIIEEIGMYGKDKGEPLEIPGKNEERTYNISVAEKPYKISVYPILEKGEVCQSSDLMSDIAYC